MYSFLKFCPAWERQPFGTLLAEEETRGARSCEKHRGCHRAREGHSLCAGTLGSQDRQHSPRSSVGHAGWSMLGWLLAALAALAQGGNITAPNLSCWKNCGSRASFHCSWSPYGPAGNTSYLLNLCHKKRSQCSRFRAGTMTSYNLTHQQVFIHSNTTAWVEARWGHHVHRTPNLTLFLRNAIKLDPPPTGIPFTKTGGQLKLWVPRPQCDGLDWPLQWEARFQREGDSGWTQVTCAMVNVTATGGSVTCALGVNGTFKVQLRHKTPHWSSYWSDWSRSISIPEEILESPMLSYQLGNLGKDGQRVLRLSWQPAHKEQRDVNYTLRTLMPGCRCALEDDNDTVVLGQEVTEHNLTLSGAEYQILLSAVNAAGPGPAQILHIPAEHHADLSFKNISVAGGTVMAQWEAPIPGSAYCFEQQTLSKAPKQGVCIQEDFLANSIHVETGTLEAQECHRFAVHSWDPDWGWSTFAVWHHYISNDSLAVPINISTGDANATLQWKPSPRATCPGVLAKYLICHVAKGDNVTYSEVDATASNYTLQNLQPGTAYRVGVWEVTEDSEGTCSTWWHFQTKALGPQRAMWRANLKYLGISLGLPAAAAIYHLSKRRARSLLFPPLPKPVGTKAIQFSNSEMSQGQPRTGLLEPSERFSPAELLLTEPNPSKEMTDTDSQPDVPQPDVPQPSPVVEKPVEVVVCPPGCGEETSFAYRRQELHNPVGSPPPGSTSCSGHPPSEEEEEEEEEQGRQGLHQPLIPIALLISDKPIIIRDEEGWDPSQENLVP